MTFFFSKNVKKGKLQTSREPVFVVVTDVSLPFVKKGSELELRCIIESHFLDCFAILGLDEFKKLWYDRYNIGFVSEHEYLSVTGGIINNDKKKRISKICFSRKRSPNIYVN